MIPLQKIKSTANTRQALKQRLEESLKSNPNSLDLMNALDIVKDLILHLEEIDKLNSILITSRGGEIEFYQPSTLKFINSYKWDGDTEELGILVESCLLI